MNITMPNPFSPQTLARLASLNSEAERTQGLLVLAQYAHALLAITTNSGDVDDVIDSCEYCDELKASGVFDQVPTRDQFERLIEGMLGCAEQGTRAIIVSHDDGGLDCEIVDAETLP